MNIICFETELIRGDLMSLNIGGKIKKITSLIRKNIDNSDTFKSNPELTNVTGWTIGFIGKRKYNGIETYQKDIEKEFKISRSTASGLLNSMEEHGYIYRKVSTVDSRLKMIYLTEEAIELHKKVLKTFLDIEEKLLVGFSEKEKNNLFEYLLRIEYNLESKEGDL
jgi:DNA-binding MarR family transcriptional regulator